MDAKAKTKFKGKIIQSLRKLTYTNPDRREAFSRAKVAPATHGCECCGVWCYSGTSDKNHSKLQDEYPNETILKEKAVADHILPVIPVEGFKNGEWDWDVYIERMHFCGADNYQIICSECHNKKSKIEAGERKKWRDLKKKKLTE